MKYRLVTQLELNDENGHVGYFMVCDLIGLQLKTLETYFGTITSITNESITLKTEDAGITIGLNEVISWWG